MEFNPSDIVKVPSLVPGKYDFIVFRVKLSTWVNISQSRQKYTYVVVILEEYI